MKTLMIIYGVLGFYFLLDSVKYYPKYPIEWFPFIIGILFILLFFVLFGASIDVSKENIKP